MNDSLVYCPQCETESRTGPIEYTRDGGDWYCDRGHIQSWTVMEAR